MKGGRKRKEEKRGVCVWCEKGRISGMQSFVMKVLLAGAWEFKSDLFDGP